MKQNKQIKNQESVASDLPLSPVIKKGKKKLTYSQSEFNRLNKRIAELKNEIALIPEKEQKIRSFYMEKAKALFDKETMLKYHYLIYLDNVYDNGKLTKLNKQTLASLILEEGKSVSEYLEEEEKRTAITRIMHKYEEIVLGQTHEELELLAVQDTLSFMQFMMGITPTETMKNAKTQEELLNAVMDFLETETRMQAEEKDKERQRSPEQEAEPSQNRKRNVTAGEMRQRIQEDQALKSMREIYLELVKELHPDREMDESARVLKEERMKQLTDAYKQKDLASLLLMQVNWLEEESRNAPQSHTDELLKKFNKLLRNQLKRLEEEFALLCRAPLTGVEGYYTQLRRVPLEDLEVHLEEGLTEQEALLQRITEYIDSVSTIEGLKDFLKKYRKKLKDEEKEREMYGEFWELFH